MKNLIIIKPKILNFTSILIVTVSMMLTSAETIAQQGAVDNEIGDKAFSLIMVYFKDMEKFQEYGAGIYPLVDKYEAYIESSTVPQVFFATNEKLKKPDMVNMSVYGSPSVEKQFFSDPLYKKYKKQAKEGADLIAIWGDVVGGELIGGDDSKRVYWTELVYFNNEQYYRNWERLAEASFNKHNYHVERELRVTKANGIDKPDLIKVSYFDTEEDYKNFQEDPEHKKIEESYGSAFDKIVFIQGSPSGMSRKN